MLNLQDPWQARRWLKLLVEDERCGYRLRANLDVPASELGFSLKSNALGLRGPGDQAADTVVFGTSFAMGIAVNNGENWHELCLPQSGWLNLGLAVGIAQWQQLAALHHRGPRRTAVLLYHPNIWIHCQMYGRWKDSGRNVFAALRWRTDWLSCCWLAWRKARAYRRGLRTGRWLEVPDADGVVHAVDTGYSAVAESEVAGVVAENIPRLVSLLEGFERVVVVRLRVKQELVPEALRRPQLRKLCRQYDELWERTVAALGHLKSVECHAPTGFVLSHFHRLDSHWNARGNRLFAQWFRSAVLGDGARTAMKC